MSEDPNESAVAVAGDEPAPDQRTAIDMPDLGAGTGHRHGGSIELLRDVHLRVRIELGRTRMAVQEVLKLGEGSVVELDKLAGDPVDVYVNDRLVARGEVLVLNDSFCVRVSEIISPAGALG
jgi:flagellar motor switch protein FliN/FliY